MNKNQKKWLVISIVIIIILALGLGLGLGLGLKKQDTSDSFTHHDQWWINPNPHQKTQETFHMVKSEPPYIPRVLHKVIIVDGGNIPPLSSVAQDALDSFSKLNPEYEMRIYSGKDCENYITKHYGEKELRAFRTLIPYSFKVDLFKFLVLYNEGGLYSDFRQVCLKPFREYIPADAKWFSTIDGGSKQHRGMACHFLAAAPGQPTFRTAIDMVINNIAKRSYGCCQLGPTGPCLLGKAFRETPPSEPRYIGEFRVPPAKIEMVDHTGQGGLIIHKHKNPKTQKEYNGAEWGKLDGGGNNYAKLYTARNIYSDDAPSFNTFP